MDPATEFRRHAEECRRMARSTVNLDDRGLWNRMAERWLGCADRAEQEKNAAQTLSRTARHRRPDPLTNRSRHAA